MTCIALTLTFLAAHCSIGSACFTVHKLPGWWLVFNVLPISWSSLQIADFEFAEVAEEPWNKVSVAREVRHSPPEALSDGVLTKVGSLLGWLGPSKDGIALAATTSQSWI